MGDSTSAPNTRTAGVKTGFEQGSGTTRLQSESSSKWAGGAASPAMLPARYHAEQEGEKLPPSSAAGAGAGLVVEGSDKILLRSEESTGFGRELDHAPSGVTTLGTTEVVSDAEPPASARNPTTLLQIRKDSGSALRSFGASPSRTFRVAADDELWVVRRGRDRERIRASDDHEQEDDTTSRDHKVELEVDLSLLALDRTSVPRDEEHSPHPRVEQQISLLPLFDPRNRRGAPLAEGASNNSTTVGSGSFTSFSGPYPFGVDPAWATAQNKLLFMNSLKMKLSVLFGVVQMFVGVLLRWANAMQDRSATDFFFECLPMMAFLLCFFGYMDYMILRKWTHRIEEQPSIINCLINMAFGGDNKNVFFAHEGYLMLVCVLCVPVLLIPKPAILLLQHKREKRRRQQAESGDELIEDVEQRGELSHYESGEDPKQAAAGGGHFDFGEVVIHQVIETIEFVLGTVSHTASYLRQWALSLAHAQLSEVFFQYSLKTALGLAPSRGGLRPSNRKRRFSLLGGAWSKVFVF